MNEHDETIARLFAQAAPLPPSDEFADSLRQAIKREHRKATLLTVVAVATFVLLVTTMALIIPFGSLYPIQRVQEFLTSTTGMLASAACAIAMTAWLRVSNA